MKKNICVYCSSSNDLEEKFYNTAQELGMKIAQNGYNLVYGGSTRGSMGAVAKAVIHNGAEAIGVIPQKMVDMGLEQPPLKELIVTKDMRERKATMEKLSDAFIAMPGGFGTYEEIFEILVGKQLDYHRKPVIFLNLDGFYDPLFDMFENVYKYKFAREKSRELYFISDNIDDIFDYLSKYEEKEFVMKW